MGSDYEIVNDALFSHDTDSLNDWVQVLPQGRVNMEDRDIV